MGITCTPPGIPQSLHGVGQSSPVVACAEKGSTPKNGKRGGKGKVKGVRFAAPEPEDDDSDDPDEPCDALDVDVENTGESNRTIVDNIVAKGLMRFPNVDAEKADKGEKFDLGKMSEADKLRGWSCPCSNKPSALEGNASTIRKAIILHLMEGKGKDGGAKHKEILAAAAPIRTNPHEADGRNDDPCDLRDLPQQDRHPLL